MIDGLVEAVARPTGDGEHRRATAGRARADFECHHTQGRVYDRMASPLDPLIESVERQRRGRRSGTCES
jgi:hypothetical protein